MPTNCTIKAEEIVADLLSGMTDSELMVKHGVTAQEFDVILGHLVDSGLVTKATLDLSDSQIVRAFVDSREELKQLNREGPRHHTRRPPPIGPQQGARPPEGKRALRVADVVRDIRLNSCEIGMGCSGAGQSLA